MTDIEKTEIRGITIKTLWVFVCGTIAVCVTVITMGLKVIQEVHQNTYDMAETKSTVKQHGADIVALQLFQARTETYFDKPKEIKPVRHQRQ